VAAQVAALDGRPSEVRPDSMSGTIVVTVFGPPVSDAELRAIQVDNLKQRSLALDLLTAPDGIAVSVTYDAAVTTQTDARGGLGFGGCTGGFIVETSTQWGIAAAQHCSTPPATYDNSTVGNTRELSDRDVQWSRLLTGSKTAQFRYTNPAAYRTATAAIDPVVGGPVCRYGKTTGPHCDRVSQRGLCWTYPDHPQYCGLFVTDNKTSEAGDSGGPVFYGNTAHGIHSGSRVMGFNGDGLFSGVGSLALLGVTVNLG
jgi:hypothetical protein